MLIAADGGGRLVGGDPTGGGLTAGGLPAGGGGSDVVPDVLRGGVNGGKPLGEPSPPLGEDGFDLGEPKEDIDMEDGTTPGTGRVPPLPLPRLPRPRPLLAAFAATPGLKQTAGRVGIVPTVALLGTLMVLERARDSMAGDETRWSLWPGACDALVGARGGGTADGADEAIDGGGGSIEGTSMLIRDPFDLELVRGERRGCVGGGGRFACRAALPTGLGGGSSNGTSKDGWLKSRDRPGTCGVDSVRCAFSASHSPRKFMPCNSPPTDLDLLL